MMQAGCNRLAARAARLLVGLAVCGASTAATYPVQDDSALVGELFATKSRASYSLVDMARHFGLGFNEISAANRHLNVWLPGDGKPVLIPARYLLPQSPRRGIVLNLAEMRLYHYGNDEAGNPRVTTYPVGIGREGWETPTLTSTISSRKHLPSWYVPESIRQEYLAKGQELPKVVGPGPDNPLGEYALRLGDSSYLIHGTNRPGGIGMRVSHGCIRLYPEHIEQLFSAVEVGTEVRIVDQPVKAGWYGANLYLEVHAPGAGTPAADVRESTTALLADAGLGYTPVIDWAAVEDALARATGVPVAVGRRGKLDPSSSWMLVAGSFAVRDDAESLVQRIGARKLPSRTWKIADRYQVEVGPFADVRQADYARRLIQRETGILALKIPPG